MPANQPSNHPAFQTALNALASKGFEVTLLHTLSPDELRPDMNGDLKLMDRETGADVEITADYDLIQRYQASLADWQNELRLFCRARSMQYVSVATDLPLEELLFAWLRQYAVLK
jgi:hypothetical protein